jgi:hypothetical protein
LAFLFSACATVPEHIEPMNVSPEPYVALDCAQLETESMSVAKQISRLRTKIESANEVTQGAIGIVGWLVFWPEVLYHRATVAPKDKADYARLTGEQRAIARVAVTKGCPPIER